MNITRLAPSEYPALLQQIKPMPNFLDCAGSLPPSTDEYKYLCVVGSRQYTSYGTDACKKLVSGLKNYPVVIVSGLAIGIDSIAHETALQNNLRVVAFPGSGLAKTSIYPQRHLRLAERIIESGNTLLSPFEPENTGDKWTFPVRNRLMAGISHATLVIEGRPGSGTLLTAGNALEFDRDVMIVPGSIFSDSSYGPHLLYRDGAIPVFTSADILRVLGFDTDEGPLAGTPEYNKPKQLDLMTLELSPEERRIINELQHSSQNTSDLIEKTGIAPFKLNVLLSRLEIQDIIVEHDGVYRVNGV